MYKDCSFVGELLQSKKTSFELLQGKLNTCSGKRKMYIAPLLVLLSTKVSNFKLISSWQWVRSSYGLKSNFR